jgi:hypothetical protein
LGVLVGFSSRGDAWSRLWWSRALLRARSARTPCDRRRVWWETCRTRTEPTSRPRPPAGARVSHLRCAAACWWLPADQLTVRHEGERAKTVGSASWRADGSRTYRVRRRLLLVALQSARRRPVQAACGLRRRFRERPWESGYGFCLRASLLGFDWRTARRDAGAGLGDGWSQWSCWCWLQALLLVGDLAERVAVREFKP